jgi:hypothetical protein
MHGLVPGDFLSAVICNDLFGAVGHADSANIKHLPAYVRFFYNVAPAQCWGSADEMRYWKRVGGWNGLMTVDEKYPTEGGLCVVCVDRNECPIPKLIKDKTMAIDKPELDKDGNVAWCFVHEIDEDLEEATNDSEE